MTTVQIQADKMKTVRKARKIGRPKLAKMTGMTERQIARLEGNGAVMGDLSYDSALRISQALEIPVGALTGELALIDDDLKPASETKCTSGCCG
ncbi:helix-turn-helix domain-containing protein [Cognatishimia activa]|uniref:helix-turn-helix domain-containing protein n=1 Tax=Cognatishimia activa TaxID=1715691 RepID=UPI002232A406|nr:helix-turn-helix transcriptional regulator [Cognatishimia activa]UZD89954.1 helix-turn-helix domain-containing protein [Cognatishimia activa]